eukprot:m.427003 g.427003  ORF g.427003 m.427003 type:complete len:68 (+) comp61373_c0_seq1:54-257(+)
MWYCTMQFSYDEEIRYFFPPSQSCPEINMSTTAVNSVMCEGSGVTGAMGQDDQGPSAVLSVASNTSR